ncbi:MAG TPA: hypothetical protein VMV69_12035 [Pirellulales bacterium]|nr:hypothetical protein [Pirellulales bacterium]
MPYTVHLSKALRKAGWKVRVFDSEVGPEEPHFTILHKMVMWRVSLRTGDFLAPEGGRWKDIPNEVIDAINDETNQTQMKAYWDKGNPHNRVKSEGNEQNG